MNSPQPRDAKAADINNFFLDSLPPQSHTAFTQSIRAYESHIRLVSIIRLAGNGES